MTILEVHLLANSSVLSVLPESTTKMSSLMSATLPRHCAIFSSSFRVKTIMERLVTWLMQKHSRPDVETHARIFPIPNHHRRYGVWPALSTESASHLVR